MPGNFVPLIDCPPGLAPGFRAARIARPPPSPHFLSSSLLTQALPTPKFIQTPSTIYILLSLIARSLLLASSDGHDNHALPYFSTYTILSTISLPCLSLHARPRVQVFLYLPKISLDLICVGSDPTSRRSGMLQTNLHTSFIASIPCICSSALCPPINPPSTHSLTG